MSEDDVVREKRRTTPNGLIGVGVIVIEGTRILLGRNHDDHWELPGGKIEKGESFEETAVRELREETALVASAACVEILSVFLDDSHGMPRLTAAALIRSYGGTPRVREHHLISEWAWHAHDRLPRPLFTPSAHVLNEWRPGLLADLPPMHAYPQATRRSPSHTNKTLG
ncbi:nucleotide triphosphate diphosphatase NUDT15 [Streptomyces bluensis]|uniref:NUDIX hydrolase n=1 Tax=Streptomyces bluensis TaxID=33897 RepID=A0ABW6UAR2_9ACTN